MSIVPSFDTGALRIRLKTAEDKVKASESGEKYVQMQEQFKAVFREQNARIRKLERELGKAHAQAARRDISIMNVSAWSQQRLYPSIPLLYIKMTQTTKKPSA